MASSKRWSRDVTEKSNALDLEASVFTKDSPRGIAESLKRSAEHSKRRKSDPYRSAMSMLTFYINRAGQEPAEATSGALGGGQGRAPRAIRQEGAKGLAAQAGAPRSGALTSWRKLRISRYER